jgi:hypothetical protein
LGTTAILLGEQRHDFRSHDLGRNNADLIGERFRGRRDREIAKVSQYEWKVEVLNDFPHFSAISIGMYRRLLDEFVRTCPPPVDTNWTLQLIQRFFRLKVGVHWSSTRTGQ